MIRVLLEDAAVNLLRLRELAGAVVVEGGVEGLVESHGGWRWVRFAHSSMRRKRRQPDEEVPEWQVGSFFQNALRGCIRVHGGAFGCILVWSTAHTHSRAARLHTHPHPCPLPEGEGGWSATFACTSPFRAGAERARPLS